MQSISWVHSYSLAQALRWKPWSIYKLGRDGYSTLLPMLGKVFSSPSREPDRHQGGQQGATRGAHGQGEARPRWGVILQHSLICLLTQLSTAMALGPATSAAQRHQLGWLQPAWSWTQPNDVTVITEGYHGDAWASPTKVPRQRRLISLASRQGTTGSLYKWLHTQPSFKTRQEKWKWSHLQLKQISASDLEELVKISGSTFSEHLGWDQAPAGDASGTTITEERGSETYPTEEETKVLPQSSPEESTVLASVFSLLSFPQKLWKPPRNWGRNVYGGSSGKGKHLREHLGESFVHKLNLYRFTRVPWDLERPPSLLEFLAKEEALSAHRKIKYFNCSPHKQAEAIHSQNILLWSA